MKKMVLLLVLAFFIVSCVPEPEQLAGVTKEELMTGKAVEKVLKIADEKKQVIDENTKQTLAQAHEKEAVDAAEHAWEDLRENAPKILEDGAIQAGVGEKFTVNVE